MDAMQRTPILIENVLGSAYRSGKVGCLGKGHHDNSRGLWSRLSAMPHDHTEIGKRAVDPTKRAIEGKSKIAVDVEDLWLEDLREDKGGMLANYSMVHLRGEAQYEVLKRKGRRNYNAGTSDLDGTGGAAGCFVSTADGD
jgi:hypothetical protein